MFTGIISALGVITQTTPLGAGTTSSFGLTLQIQTPPGYLDDVQLGDSIALNGACMTVTKLDTTLHQFNVDVSAESLAKTAGLNQLRAVNLEKAMRPQDRLGGHMVSGHVDATGVVQALKAVGESHEFIITAPLSLARFLAYKGSVTVNGVSLTVNQVVDHPTGCDIHINLIPHTLTHTTLGQLKAGDAVNLEIDLIARYCERMLSLQGTRTAAP